MKGDVTEQKAAGVHYIALILYSFFQRFLPYMPFVATFLSKEKNLGNSQIVVFLAVYSIGVFLLEVPTGVIADRFSNKLSMLLGSFSLLIAMLLVLFTKNIVFLYLSQFLCALGDSLNSGSSETYSFAFFESNKSHYEKKSINYEKFVSLLQSLMWTGLTLSFLLSSLFIGFGYYIPYYLTLTGFAINLLCVFVLPNCEKKSSTFNFSDSSVKEKSSLKSALKEIFFSKQILFYLIVSAITSALVSSVYLLLQPLMNERGFSGFSNGFLYAGATVFASLGSYIQPVISSIFKTKQKLFTFLFFICILLVIGFGLVNNFICFIVLFCVFRIVNGLFSPLLISILNLSLKDSKNHTTILSLTSLLSNAFQSVLLYAVSFASVLSVQYFSIAVVLFCLLLVFISFGKYFLKSE